MRARAARSRPISPRTSTRSPRARTPALYGAEPFRLPDIVSFFTRDFPRALRKNARFFAIACALFFLPSLVGIAGALASDEFAAHVLPSSVLQGMAQVYSEGPSGRDAGHRHGHGGVLRLQQRRDRLPLLRGTGDALRRGRHLLPHLQRPLAPAPSSAT